MYNVEILMSFNYLKGGSLYFKKQITLPFVPFYGLTITIDDRMIELIKDECSIVWNIEKSKFFVYVSWEISLILNEIITDSISQKFKNWEQI